MKIVSLPKQFTKHIIFTFLNIFILGVGVAHAAHDNPSVILAIKHADRPAFDIERDPGRKPQQVLEFFNVRPGMTVIDIFSGGGYYTELLSYSVGEKGRVIAHNNRAYNKYVAKTLKARYQQGRLTNVTRIVAEANELEFQENSADMVFLILAYHDIYYHPKKGWPTIERKDFIDRLYRALKPGGTLAVIDHMAAPGSDRTAGHQLHRISEKIVIDEVVESGFVLKSTADFLKNNSDDLNKHMYAPEIRGKTSRFVLKFIKPLTFDKQLVEENIPQSQ